MENTCYVFEALRCNKDNPELAGKKLSIRHIVKNPDIDKKIIKYKASLLGKGKWRLYRTVNKRDCNKARKELLHFLIDNPETIHIESIWKTILLQPSNKAEKLFLLDIDSNELKDYHSVMEKLLELKINPIDFVTTINGFHVIVPGFDTRGFVESFDFEIGIKKDALFFMEMFEVN